MFSLFAPSFSLIRIFMYSLASNFGFSSRLRDPVASRYGVLPVSGRSCVCLLRAPAGRPQPSKLHVVCLVKELRIKKQSVLSAKCCLLFFCVCVCPLSVPQCRKRAGPGLSGPSGSQPSMAGADRQCWPSLPLPVPPLPQSGEQLPCYQFICVNRRYRNRCCCCISHILHSINLYYTEILA